MARMSSFIDALGELRRTRGLATTVWSLVAALLILATAQPSASGLEFAMTTRLNLPALKLTGSGSNAPTEEGALFMALEKGTLFSSELASVALAAKTVEFAKTKEGAKVVARGIAQSEYGWGKNQFACLSKLWGKESAWDYKAHNYRSGAHGIAQALPAAKMEIVGADWRTNPVTQMRWGMRYISERYTNPCSAWLKWTRKNHY